MSITHEEARQLIQFKVDRSLSKQDRSALDAHLAICQICNTYAGQLARTEAELRQVMMQQWTATPRRLRAADVQGKTRQRWMNNFIPVRRLLAGVATMLFAFTIWQFALTGWDTNPMLAAQVSPNPTPSISSATGTQNSLVGCNQFQYRIHTGETLAEIAKKFSISIETLTELNHLSQDEVDQLSYIMIPLCTSTPSSTNHAPESTLTPGLQTFTTTPG